MAHFTPNSFRAVRFLLGGTAVHTAARGALVRITVLGSLVLFLSSTGCGASDAPMTSCLAMPQSCAAGTTCWPIDMGTSYQCLPSKSYVALGADCALLVGLTTCGDDLICAPMTGQNKIEQTRCTSYCDANNPCPAQATCVPVSLFATGPQISVCILPPPA